MSEFRDRLNAAGLLHPEDDPQQAANDGLMREYQADRVTQQRLPDGSVVVRLFRTTKTALWPVPSCPLMVRCRWM